MNNDYSATVYPILNLYEMIIEIEKLIDIKDLFTINMQPPVYINRLHPRKDFYIRIYWQRIRSNPTRKNYH